MTARLTAAARRREMGGGKEGGAAEEEEEKERVRVTGRVTQDRGPGTHEL